MPTFFDANNTCLSMASADVERWLQRLRILYQIHKGQYYQDVIDRIISILQFIPSNILLTHVHASGKAHVADESMLNDIMRARMFILEEWAADGDPFCSVSLNESYRAASFDVLVTVEPISNDPLKK
jgi:hypothetical protein